MDNSEDYYEILQVHHLAEPEIIEAAYKKLAQKYHPDINKSSSAAERMKKINEAHDVLGDPVRKREYDSQRAHSRAAPPPHREQPREQHREAPRPPKQRPILKVIPKHIRFKDLDFTQIKTTHFDVLNEGGPFTGFGIGTDKLPEWLEVTSIEKLGGQQLPARVNIRAYGGRVRGQYDCLVSVRIENSEYDYADETHVRIEVAVKGPVLEMDTAYLKFDVMTDIIPQPRSVRLVNTGVGFIEGDLVPRQKWIKVSPRHVSFDHQQVVQVQIDTSKLLNNMIGYIDVKTNCAQAVITVEASIVEQQKKKGK